MRSGKTHSALLERKANSGPWESWHVELESETFIQTQTASYLSLLLSFSFSPTCDLTSSFLPQSSKDLIYTLSCCFIHLKDTRPEKKLSDVLFSKHLEKNRKSETNRLKHENQWLLPVIQCGGQVNGPPDAPELETPPAPIESLKCGCVLRKQTVRWITHSSGL